MRDRLAFALSAAIFLFLSEALRALLGALFAGLNQALFPVFNPVALAIALLPLLALLAPLLPLVRWLDRDRVVAYTAAAAAILRVGLCLPGLAPRAIFSALVIACCALFIVAATGSFGRRIYAAGAVTGLVLDLMLRVAGRSYDLSLRPQWWPAQLAIAALVLMVATSFRSTPEPEDETDQEERLERRTGGLRLRGALSLGCILFMLSTTLGMPEVAARLTGLRYDQTGLMMLAAGAAAIAVLLAIPGPPGRHRPAAVALSGVGTLGTIAPYHIDGWIGALWVVAGYFALLVLVYRALAPAGGRRGGWVISAGLGLLVIFQLLYGFTFFYAFTIGALRERAAQVLAVAGILLIVGLVITPRPSPSRPRARRTLPLAAAGVSLLLLGLSLQWRAEPGAIVPTAAGTLRVVTYNVHYGFSERWRYDPEALARALESTAADVIVLQEVSAGVPGAYGTDLALWLGRRLRMQNIFAPSINRLLGDAFLTRLPIISFDSALLPPDSSDRKQLGRLTVQAGRSPVTIFGTHLSVIESERQVQIAAALSLAGRTTPAVFAGDLNDSPGSAIFARLEAAGFQSVFDLLGRPHLATAPAIQPRESIDHILVRGMHVEHAGVFTTVASDHRPVLATLRAK